MASAIANPLRNVILLRGILPAERCAEIVRLAENHGAWTTDRHTHYPTTDIPAQDIRGLDLGRELEGIVRMTRSRYELGEGARIVPFDVFVVKYSMSGQRQLSVHRDGSELSFLVALSDPAEFEGGGTRYLEMDRVVRPRRGDLLLHCGKVRHAGVAITGGTRYILIGFMRVASPRIGRMLPGDQHFPNSVCDKRWLDFLWRHTPAPRSLRVCVINLDTRPERWRRIHHRVHQLPVPANWTVTLQRVQASTGGGALPYQGWRLPGSSHPYWSRDIRRGEIGCTLSHLGAIKSCRDTLLLLMEDDAEFQSDLFYRLDQCLQELRGIEWDALDFGGVPVDNSQPVAVTESLVSLGCTYAAHCILYHRRGMDKIRWVSSSRDIVPWDEFLPAARGVPSRRDLNTLCRLRSPLRLFHTYVPLSTQPENGIHDTERD